MAAPMDQNMFDAVKKILKENHFLHLDEKTNKVKCTLSQHEMPCQVAAVQSYINGKKYKKLAAKASIKDDLDKYKQHLVPSNKKGHEKQLFCQLTLRHLNNQPHHIQRHVKGRRFTKALARWEECQKSGEKFVPRLGRTKQRRDDMGDSPGKRGDKKEFWQSDSEEEQEPQDDLSDLYPEEDFAESESEGDSDFEFENLETKAKENTSTTNSHKRAAQGDSKGIPAKKLKIQKSKRKVKT